MPPAQVIFITSTKLMSDLVFLSMSTVCNALPGASGDIYFYLDTVDDDELEEDKEDDEQLNDSS